jgi:hypothetical protein
VLIALYVSTAAAGFLLLAASVARELLFRTPAVELPRSALKSDAPDPNLLLECNDLVSKQLTSLSTTTSRLFAQPFVDPEANVDALWSEFSRKWRDDWDVTNAQCRFSDLSGTRMGDAYDRMAQVHLALPEMRLKYQELLVRFDEEQAAELAEMRRALDRSRDALLEQTAPPQTKGAL